MRRSVLKDPALLSPLLEVSQTLGSPLNLRASLAHVLEVLEKSRGMVSGSVVLRDEDAGDLAVEAVPAALITFLEQDLKGYGVQGCTTPQTCALLQVNLDDEPDLEYVVVVGDSRHETMYTLWGYDQTAATTWFRLGTFVMPGHNSTGRAALFEQIRRHGVETALPVYKNVKIGTLIFKLRDY